MHARARVCEPHAGAFFIFRRLGEFRGGYKIRSDSSRRITAHLSWTRSHEISHSFLPAVIDGGNLQGAGLRWGVRGAAADWMSTTGLTFSFSLATISLTHITVASFD